MANEFKNVRVSVLKHFEDQLAATSSIDLPGVPINTDVLTEWLEPRIIGVTPVPTRSGERFETYLLGVNAYAKVGEDDAGNQQENIHRPWELADAVRGVFHQATIAVQDWASVGDPEIGHIRFGEIQITPVPAGVRRTQLEQVNASVEGTLIIGG